jgi:hypothetical protein
MSLFATLKSAARRAVAPLARPIWRRVRPRLAKVADLFRLSAAWHQYAPALANAAASVGAVAREQARMKREYDAAIAELKASIAQLRESPSREPQSQGPSSAAVAGTRVHIGPVARPGYTNVNVAAGAGIDIVCPFDALPFGAGELAEISVQGLDAMRPAELAHLLPAWMRLLKPGGVLRATK